MAPLTDDKSNLVENGHVQNPNGSVPESNAKSLVIAYLLWFPFGLLGFHRMYLGHWFMGIIYFFTAGYAGIGWIVDGILLPGIVKETNGWAQYWAAHPEKVKRPAPFRYHYLECCAPLNDRSLRDAYILTLHPLGIFGFQHQYLGRPWYRLAYTFSVGLCGVGWLTDMFRMPSLVKQANEEIAQLRSGMSEEDLQRSDISDCTTLQAYLFAIPGVFGFHHFYLGRWKFGLVYLFTLGLCGIGWLVDLIRMPLLVQRSNQERKERTQNTKHLDDAYLLAFPLGVLGFHHFYLNRPCLGVVYIFTLGLFGIGWLIDFCRMPFLVREANLRNKQNVVIIPANPQHPTYVIPGDNAYVFTAGNHYTYPQNSMYPNAPSHPSAAPQRPPQYAPAPVGYQSEYPPTYTEALSNENQPQQQMKQYPPS